MPQICFVVMPFGTKETGPAGKQPPKVDFDHLWSEALHPVLTELGYSAIRADAEAGSVIVKDMLQRLRYADLVVADLSIPNGNVYYEVGIRHAAQERGCVLIAADWCKRLFDLAQIRTLPYAHAGEKITSSEADELKATLRAQLRKYAQAQTPYYELASAEDPQLFREKLEELYDLQQSIRALTILGDKAQQEAEKLVERILQPGELPALDAVGSLVLALRDLRLWKLQESFITRVSEQVSTPLIEEQLQLARSELGDFVGSAAALETLIEKHGGTPERYGLLGGRYKRLWRDARKARVAGATPSRPSNDERKFLTRSIANYEAGMRLDLNDYYCSCNLPALLRERRGEGDELRAQLIDVVVLEACRRAEQLGSGDQWLYPTLFGSAFRTGDVGTVKTCLPRLQDTPGFHLETTLQDAQLWLEQAPEASRPALRSVVDELR
jgi:hypothetical protein